MEELDIAAVLHRSIRGVVALVSRTLFIQVLNLFAQIFLTILLMPSIYGVYLVVSSVIAFLSYFSDIGLAAALIQKKEAITQDDLRTTFTLQQLLVITASAIFLLLSPWISKFYHFDSASMGLFYVLIISFFLSSLKTIPSVLLERNLHFDKLVIPQIVETLVFDITVIFCAWKGLEVTSFTYAVLFRGIAGLVSIYLIAPWKIELGISKKTAKHLLSFGIPFQANSFLALLKDDLLIAYIGKALPFSQVGYIGFAQKWAYTPLRVIMDNVIRITFPSFARLQHDMKSLGKAVEKSLFASTLIIFPSLAGLVLAAPFFIVLIPKYNKWEPAILSLGIFAINAALSAVSTPLTNALNAIGKIKITLYLMIFWTITTWVLTPILLYLFGFNGFAYASVIISLSVVGVVYVTKKFVDFSITSVFPPAIGTIIMIGVLSLAKPLLPVSWIGLFVLIILGMLSYFGSVFAMSRDAMMSDLQLIRKQFIK